MRENADQNNFEHGYFLRSVRDEELPITLQEVTNGRCKVPNYLRGDPAYPLTSFCMKEVLPAQLIQKLLLIIC